ncbi:unnamed protein product [Sphagnum compactum]
MPPQADEVHHPPMLDVTALHKLRTPSTSSSSFKSSSASGVSSSWGGRGVDSSRDRSNSHDGVSFTRELQAGDVPTAATVLDGKGWPREPLKQEDIVQEEHKADFTAGEEEEEEEEEDTINASDPRVDWKFSGELDKYWMKLRGSDQEKPKKMNRRHHTGFQPEARWQGDTARREELARRVILENGNGGGGGAYTLPSSPLSHHLLSCNSQGSFSTLLKVQAVEDERLAGCESLFQTDRAKEFSGDVSLFSDMCCSQEAAAAATVVHGHQSISSLDSEVNGLPLLADDEDTHGTSDHSGTILLKQLSSKKPTKEHQSKAVSLSTGGEQETHRTLSQKYRPQSFKEVVGQSMVIKSLSTSIMKGKVAPVYLFMGPRGTGKTTTARIFAAALNCCSSHMEQWPCRNCQECKTISLNSSQDVKEIDASNNADIESMRAMLGTFSPSHARYKVIIVDGCDFLTTEVWNAFLKVLEEPPKNLVFILITTEVKHLPLTVISRCQKFPFSKVKEEDMVKRLKILAAKEHLEVETEALKLMASTADGSLRDAETTMDQLSLLDKRISLTAVQELVGLIPDGKLLELLDLALSAEAGNTVRFMRELLKSGVEPLSLVSQLASLITNILAGSFDVHPETHLRGFFRKNFSQKEEQQRLREALKVLAEAEKQLQVASDQPTWLTAALLQFAPDRSFLPSSVNTSIAPSPAASNMSQRTTTFLRQHARFEEESQTHHRRKMEEAPHHFGPALGRKFSAYLDHRKNNHNPSSIRLKTKVHPVSPLDNHTNLSEWKLEAAWAREVVHAETDDGYDDSFNPGSSCLLRMMDRQHLEKTWARVLQICQSKVLRHLLQSDGKLIAVGIQDEDMYAIAQLEFHHPEPLKMAERSESSIRHAFQMVLSCPVELRISLKGVQNKTVRNKMGVFQNQNSSEDLQALLASRHKTDHRLKRTFEENTFEASGLAFLDDMQGVPWHNHYHRSRARKHRRAGGMKEQETENQTPVSQVGTSWSHKNHIRRSSASVAEQGESGQSQDSPWPQASERYSSSSHGFSSSLASLLEAESKGRRALLKTMMEEEPDTQLETLDENWSLWSMQQGKHKHVKFREGNNLAASIEEENSQRIESQLKPTREVLHSWNAPQPEKLKGKLGRQRAKGKELFFRFVPCGKSNKTILNNG